jgi:hypothetical protein
MLNAQFRGKLYIDPTRIPKGAVYGWVREYIQGEPDDNNVQERLMGGWKPVPADRHPELVPPALPGREQDTSNVIRRGGLILCEISRKEYAERRAEIQAENYEAIQGIAWTRGELQDNDSRMPMVDYGSSEVTIERVVELPKD